MSAADRATAVATVERFGMPAERAAAQIIRAVERDRRRVLVGGDARGAVLLKRIFPVGFQRLLTVAFRRGLRA